MRTVERWTRGPGNTEDRSAESKGSQSLENTGNCSSGKSPEDKQGRFVELCTPVLYLLNIW